MLLNQLNAQRRSQQGAALIAVLVILVVITLLGVTAMRMSLTGLTLATNSQINGLLFEAADKGMVDVAGRNYNTLDADLKAASGATTGSNVSEAAYCVTGAVTNIVTGQCNPSVSTNYANSRQLALTQVNVYRNTDIEDASLSFTTFQTVGTPGHGAASKVKISSTTVMPSLGSASNSQINGCLTLPSDDTSPDPTIDRSSIVTITDCLTDSGAVFTTHVQDFNGGFNE